MQEDLQKRNWLPLEALEHPQKYANNWGNVIHKETVDGGETETGDTEKYWIMKNNVLGYN